MSSAFRVAQQARAAAIAQTQSVRHASINRSFATVVGGSSNFNNKAAASKPAAAAAAAAPTVNAVGGEVHGTDHPQHKKSHAASTIGQPITTTYVPNNDASKQKSSPSSGPAVPSSSAGNEGNKNNNESSGFATLVKLLGVSWLSVQALLYFHEPTRRWLEKNYPDEFKKVKGTVFYLPTESNDFSSGKAEERKQQQTPVAKSLVASPAPSTPSPSASSTAAVKTAVAATPRPVSPSPSTSSAPVATPAPVAVTSTKSTPPPSPPAPVAAPKPVEPAPVPLPSVTPLPQLVPLTSAAASKLSPGQMEMAELLLQLKHESESIKRLIAVTEQNTSTQLRSFEGELKDRALKRIVTLESDQESTLHYLQSKEQSKLERQQYLTATPVRKEFEAKRLLEEENKHRAVLYNLLFEQNDKYSKFADEWLQTEEQQTRRYYTEYVHRLKNAVEALEVSTVKPLRQKLVDAKHRELRSKQAHALSAALLVLDQSLSKSHKPLQEAWGVVQTIAKEDYTLRQAVSKISDDLVTFGVYAPGDLKRAFAVLSDDLKVSTFLPDSENDWSIPREALAYAFSAMTIEEKGGVVLPVPTPAQPKANASQAKIDSLLDASHQSADYAHYINASTYIASDAFDLALNELEAMQPSRKKALTRFLEELRKTVLVQQAIKVVRMRVLAMNADAAAFARA